MNRLNCIHSFCAADGEKVDLLPEISWANRFPISRKQDISRIEVIFREGTNVRELIISRGAIFSSARKTSASLTRSVLSEIPAKEKEKPPEIKPAWLNQFTQADVL